MHLKIDGWNNTVLVSFLGPERPIFRRVCFNTHRIHVWHIYLHESHEWLIPMVNAGKFTIYGSYGIGLQPLPRKDTRLHLMRPLTGPGAVRTELTGPNADRDSWFIKGLVGTLDGIMVL